MRTSFSAISIVFFFLSSLAGCAPLGRKTVSSWQGRTPARIAVQLSYSQPDLPAKAWLLPSDRAKASGFVSFTKWGAGGEAYKQHAFFVVQEKADYDAIGLLERREATTVFCTFNPEHGGFVRGQSFVITTSYDYCASLARK